MKKAKVYVVDGKEYLVTRTVKLDGKKYKELISADIMYPDTLYAEIVKGDLQLVDDWDIYYPLCKKHAVHEKSLDGDIFLEEIARIMQPEKFREELSYIADLKDITLKTTEIFEYGSNIKHHIIDSGEYKDKTLFIERTRNGSTFGHTTDFFLDKANEELAKRFEDDVTQFSQSGAKAFGHILAKHGITNPQEWLEEKMRDKFKNKFNSSYSYKQDIFTKARCYPWGEIEYSSLEFADNRFGRAHEMAHKITNEFRVEVFGGKPHPVGRSGIAVFKMKEKSDKNTGEVHYIEKEIGRALNEGVINLMAEKATEETDIEKVYSKHTSIARRVAGFVGEDTLFESAFFGPEILANRWNELFHNKYAYSLMAWSVDVYHKITEPRTRLQLGAVIKPIKTISKKIAHLFRKKPVQLPVSVNYDSKDLFKENETITNIENRESIALSLKHLDNLELSGIVANDLKEKTNSKWNTKLRLIFTVLDSLLFP